MAAVSAEGKTLCILMRRYASFHALFTAVLGWLDAVFVYPLLEQVINRPLAGFCAHGTCSVSGVDGLHLGLLREPAPEGAR
ncbi:MAG: hypothetical protein M3461_12135 [Pseudomonadota bacterium]|nr:hypothetical protein [Pseudomonadota bacterium]